MSRPVFGDASLPDRFWDKVYPDPMSGCWLWTGSTGRWGYGNFQEGSRTQGTRRMRNAHRISYEAFVGPSHREIDHLCRTRCCVNPEHLEDVSHAENGRRGESQMAHQARQTTCKHGHDLVGNNVYRWRGHRCCIACRRNVECRRSKRRAQRRNTAG